MKEPLMIRPSSLFKSVVETAGKLGEATGRTVANTSHALVKTSKDVGGVIRRGTARVGRSVAEFSTGLGTTAARQTHQLVEQATTTTGQAVTFVGDSPLISRLSDALKLDWLVEMSDRVDISKAESVVRKLQQEHPDESSGQIAHRIMTEKAIYAGGVGLVTSLVPGQAVALLAVDLATMTALQTEMLYQIAAAYHLDLNDPARKGEVIAIFGLALGGNRAIKAGTVFVKNLPLAGMIIGASANATMLYALGYAACRFYEAKTNPEVAETSNEMLQEMQQRSDTYLEVAIAQQAVMDQVLTQMILASYPETRWEDILPNLQSLGLHPTSLQAIADHLKAPQPLVSLLDQLNQDFAALTLSRCYAIAQLDGVVTSEEQSVLEVLSNKFEIDLETVKAKIDTATSTSKT
uniref:EcsC family protein n=1 Tax=Oscillatoriales cyanobacterium SpSt-402 TaxID=2282168 RepID=A0A832M1C4_9CYAN